VALLEDIARKQGIDTDAVYQEAGLNHSEVSDISWKEPSIKSSLKTSCNKIDDVRREVAETTETDRSISCIAELDGDDGSESET